MSKTYTALEIREAKTKKKQVSLREPIYQLLETVHSIEQPLKKFNLNEAIEDMVMEIAKKYSLISQENEEMTPEQLYGKCLGVYQEISKVSGSFYDSAQNFATQMEGYLKDNTEPKSKLHVNKASAL